MTTRKKNVTLTLGDVTIPKIEPREWADIPLEVASDRWAFVDWDAVRQVIRSGKAICLPVPPDELEMAKSHIRRLFINEEVWMEIETKYCVTEQQLWVY